MSTEQDATEALVVAAMMQALDQKKRDELIAKALEALVATPMNSYTRRQDPSPLDEAFQSAVRSVANQIVKEMVDTDDIRTRIRALIASAFEKMLSDNDNLSTKMAEAIVSAMSRRD